MARQRNRATLVARPRVQLAAGPRRPRPVKAAASTPAHAGKKPK